MENTGNINSSDDNIIAIIDGVVYAKRPRGKPRNPLRWREDGRHITGYLDREKRIEYNQKYKELRTCEICKKELQILHFKRHQTKSKCAMIRELQETKEKLSKLETYLKRETNSKYTF